MNEKVTVTVDSITKVYGKAQVRQIVYGIDKPAPGEVVSVTDFIHTATDTIWSITGEITHRKRVFTPEGRELIVDIENNYDITQLNLFPTRYGFFGRRGSYLRADIINGSTQTAYSVQFRVTLYGIEDKLLSSKDFYIKRLPGSENNFAGRRVFEIDLPDVPFEQVTRVRVVRQF